MSNIIRFRPGRRLKSLPNPRDSRRVQLGGRPRPSPLERRLIVASGWALAGFGAVIAVMLALLFPDTPARVRAALRDPARDLPGPFRNCTAAHAAGFYSIPNTSPAYVDRQDDDFDGFACEPIHGGGPIDGMRRIVRKWTQTPTS